MTSQLHEEKTEKLFNEIEQVIYTSFSDPRQGDPKRHLEEAVSRLRCQFSSLYEENKKLCWNLGGLQKIQAAFGRKYDSIPLLSEAYKIQLAACPVCQSDYCHYLGPRQLIRHAFLLSKCAYCDTIYINPFSEKHSVWKAQYDGHAIEAEFLTPILETWLAKSISALNVNVKTVAILGPETGYFHKLLGKCFNPTSISVIEAKDAPGFNTLKGKCDLVVIGNLHRSASPLSLIETGRSLVASDGKLFIPVPNVLGASAIFSFKRCVIESIAGLQTVITPKTLSLLCHIGKCQIQMMDTRGCHVVGSLRPLRLRHSLLGLIENSLLGDMILCIAIRRSETSRKVKPKTTRILVVGETHLPSYVIRLKEPLQALKGKKFKIRFATEKNVSLKDIRRYDVLIVQRAASPKALQIIQNANFFGVTTIYDIDDLLWDVPEYLSSFPLYASKLTKKNIRQMIAEANFVTVSTWPLAKELVAFRDTAVYLFPNTVSIPAPSRRSRLRSKSELKLIMSNTDTQSVEFVIPVLNKIANRNPNIEIWCVGKPVNGLKAESSIRQIPILSYQRYRRLLRHASFDLAIVPLEDNAFTRCKSNIKFIEYSAFGIPGVYSNVEAYRRDVGVCERGILVDNTPESWEAGIELMLSSEVIRKNIADSALAYTKENYSCQRSSEEFQSFLTLIAGRKDIDFVKTRSYDLILRKALMKTIDMRLNLKKISYPEF